MAHPGNRPLGLSESTHLAADDLVYIQVENLSQRLAQSDSAAQVMNYYHQLMEQDRHNFETEIAENFPDMKPGNEGKSTLQVM